MDAPQYDRIADLLCQIRLKIRHDVQYTHKGGEFTIDHYCNTIESLLKMTDALADLDAKGLL